MVCTETTVEEAEQDNQKASELEVKQNVYSVQQPGIIVDAQVD